MTRTSWLQIRISPDEKVTLKRLAGLEGLSLSAYVLSRALPTVDGPVDAALDALRAGSITHTRAVEALRRLVTGLDPTAVGDSLAHLDIAGLPTVTQNYLAGVAEEMALAAGTEPPRWAAEVPPLERPHFRWPLQSLRPFQLRASPLALARRNVFDPTEMDPPASIPWTGPGPGQEFHALAQHLRLTELDVEFYFLAGAVLRQVLPRRGSTARPSRLFRRKQLGQDPVMEVAARQGWAAGWEDEAVRQVVRPSAVGGRFLELPHVKVFAPPPAYVLAIKLAARREGDSPALEDLRFLLRLLNLPGPGQALALVGQYVSERYLAPDTRSLLSSLTAR